MSDSQRAEDPIWPADRFEVICEREAPHGMTRDRYHSADNAVDSAKRLEAIGMVRRVWVVRLADDTVVYGQSKSDALL